MPLTLAYEKFVIPAISLIERLNRCFVPSCIGLPNQRSRIISGEIDVEFEKSSSICGRTSKPKVRILVLLGLFSAG